MPSFTCQNETKYTIKKIYLLFLNGIKIMAYEFRFTTTKATYG